MNSCVWYDNATFHHDFEFSYGKKGEQKSNLSDFVSSNIQFLGQNPVENLVSLLNKIVKNTTIVKKHFSYNDFLTFRWLTNLVQRIVRVLGNLFWRLERGNRIRTPMLMTNHHSIETTWWFDCQKLKLFYHDPTNA